MASTFRAATQTGPKGQTLVSKRAKANCQYLEKDLHRLAQLELTTDYVVRPLVGAGLALVVIVLAGVTGALALGSPPSVMLVRWARYSPPI